MKNIILLALAAASLSACNDTPQDTVDKAATACRDGVEVLIFNRGLRNEWGMVRTGRYGVTYPCGADMQAKS